MSRHRKAATASNDHVLQLAFRVVDRTAAKLDALKQKYNDTAADLVKVSNTPPPPPPEIAPPPLPPMRPKFDSRYKTGPRPQTDILPPLPPPLPQSVASSPKNAPRPSPRIQSKSGRYFLQFKNANDPEELRRIREAVSKTGRVVDSGTGTASNPQAGWLEVATRAEDTGSFITRLDELAIKDSVEKVIEVAPGEGRLQAKQLDLFRKKADSRS
jgi:hypothetical protein